LGKRQSWVSQPLVVLAALLALSQVSQFSAALHLVNQQGSHLSAAPLLDSLPLSRF
jgi:hypothetical protein